jgi:hypothetical protein
MAIIIVDLLNVKVNSKKLKEQWPFLFFHDLFMIYFHMMQIIYVKFI